jgi:MFS family permease
MTTSLQQGIRPGFSWYYGWNVLAVGTLVVAMTIGIGISSFSFFAVAWMAEFGSSRAEIMLVLTAMQLGSGLLVPFSGRAMDRLSIRLVGMAGLLCLIAALVLASLATQLWQIVTVFTLLMAAASAMAGSIFAPTLAAKWFRGRRGLAIGLASLGTSFGALVFPLLTTYLIAAFDWRVTLQVLAAVVAVVALPPLWWLVRDTPEQKGVEPEPEAVGQTPRPASDSGWTMVGILRQPAFWCMVAGFIPLSVASSGFVSNFGPFTQDLGISQQGAGFLLSIWSLTVIFSKVGFGMMADKVGMGPLYIVSSVPTLIALIILQLEPGYLAMVVVMIVMGIGSGGNLPLIGVIISRHFGPLAFGVVMGLFMLASRLTAFAPPAAGWVRDHSGSYDPFWLGVLILCCLCAPFMYFLRDSKA